MKQEIRDMEKRAERLNTILKEEGKEFRLEYYQTWKNNCTFEGYVLRGPVKKLNISPIIYNNPLEYNWYEQDDRNVIEFLSEKYDELLVPDTIPEEILKNREMILSKILPKLVGSEHNKKELIESGKAFVEFENLDLCMLFYLPLDQELNLQVCTKQLEIAGNITLEEAKEHAIANLEKSVEVKTMKEILNDMIWLDDCSRKTEDEMDSLVICRNVSTYNGAAAIFCQTAQKKLQELLGNDVILLPSSVHEFIAVSGEAYCSSEEIEFLREMVESVNREEVDPVDRLTDSVYRLHDGIIDKIA